MPEAADVVHQLVERRVDEAVELDLGHGPGPADGHADRGADDPGLVERSVDDPVTAEVAAETLRDPEDTTGDADVLAEHDDRVVAIHHLAQRGVDGLGHVHLRRGTRGPFRFLVDVPDLVSGEL